MLKPTLIQLRARAESEEGERLTAEEQADVQMLEAAMKEHREDYIAALADARAAWAKFAHARRNSEPNDRIFFEQFTEARDRIPQQLWDSFDFSFIRRDSMFGAADPKPEKQPKAKKQERYCAA